MELYKYYYNISSGSFFSAAFFNQFLKSFNIFYTGNLLWLAIFILALVSLINILRYIEKVREEALTILVVITILLTILLVISVFLPGSEAMEKLSGLIGTKSTKTIALSLFGMLKVFLAISYSVIAFSALKKYYIFRSIWVTIFIMLLGVLIVFLSIYYYTDNYDTLVKENKKLDAGVILGAAVWGGNRPSPVLRERINKGYELYKNGNIGYLVLTGGGSPGEMTEAEVARNELLKKGIDAKNIIVENRSNSTLEQISFVNKNLYQENNWKEIVLITDNFHLLRSSQMCSFFNIRARTVASDTPLSTESTFSYSMKESFALILFWLFGIG